MTSETRRSICFTTAVIVAFAAAVTLRVVFDEIFAPRIFHRVLIEESQSKEKCEAAANRIFVTTNLGTECVAYFVTKGFETRRQACCFSVETHLRSSTSLPPCSKATSPSRKS